MVLLSNLLDLVEKLYQLAGKLLIESGDALGECLSWSGSGRLVLKEMKFMLGNALSGTCESALNNTCDL